MRTGHSRPSPLQSGEERAGQRGASRRMPTPRVSEGEETHEERKGTSHLSHKRFVVPVARGRLKEVSAAGGRARLFFRGERGREAGRLKGGSSVPAVWFAILEQKRLRKTKKDTK